MECPYCSAPIWDAADAKRFGGRYLHADCHDRFIEEWDAAFADSLDETVQEIEAGHTFEELAGAMAGTRLSAALEEYELAVGVGV